MAAGSREIRSPSVLEFVSWPVQLLNALVIAAGAVAFGVMLRDMPDVVPVHWGVSGADRFGRPEGFWWFLAAVAFSTVMGWVVAGSTARQRPPVDVPEPRRYRALMNERKRLVVRMTGWLFTSLNVGFVIVWLGVAHAASTLDDAFVGKTIALGFSVIAVGLAFPMWHYGRRIGATQKRMVALGGPGTPDTLESGWRGVIYYAPDDPKLVVPKRYGGGWTFNFARPAAWVLLGALVLLPLAILFTVAVLR